MLVRLVNGEHRMTCAVFPLAAKRFSLFGRYVMASMTYSETFWLHRNKYNVSFEKLLRVVLFFHDKYAIPGWFVFAFSQNADFRSYAVLLALSPTVICWNIDYPQLVWQLLSTFYAKGCWTYNLMLIIISYLPVQLISWCTGKADRHLQHRCASEIAFPEELL